ncbi:hypothetical protein [Castellaniella denitrificans]|uniref:Uncharacterized protein n=1 Tax=Castellaniella denitrificans TaxID=56119 RepID=A0ABT4M6L5_9BURK|nr:hypothetical protein [Castellaniella denitrificans]MCZ4330734.1 hypothetical protein [Castellaniella denitrificans]
MTDKYEDLWAALADGSLRLDHMAVAEMEGVRWMSGRRLPAGVPSVELHGIRGGARVHGCVAVEPETIRALLADYDRMRDALETIAVYPHARDQEMSTAAMRKIARAALAQEQGGSDGTD